MYRTFSDNGREDFNAVSGILRLANKYEIDKLRCQALDHLSIAWTTTLKNWDAREDLARMYELESGMQQGFRYPSPIVRTIPSLHSPTSSTVSVNLVCSLAPHFHVLDVVLSIIDFLILSD